MNALQFRPALPADCLALARLVNSAYRGESSRAGWTTEADLLGGQRTDEMALAQALASGHIILAAEDGSEILGCVELQKFPSHGHIGMLTVQPKLQAHGLGRILLARAEGWIAREWQLPRAELWVISRRKELIAWYERRGYQRMAGHQPFPYGNERFGLPKEAGLDFLRLEKSLAMAAESSFLLSESDPLQP